MSVKFANLVEDLTESDSFGNIVLMGTPPAGKLSFGSAYDAGDDVYYLMSNSGSSEWELGRGVMINETTIRRETIIKSSNSNNRVHFSPGVKTITNPLTKESLESGIADSGIQIVTTTVQTNVGTKQALLAAVPTGKVRIVTQAVARNASEDLTDMPDDLGFGFTAGASGWAGSLSAAWAELANNARVVYIPAANQSSAPAGIAGEIFGCIFYDTSITATLDIDVHYYDVDA